MGVFFKSRKGHWWPVYSIYTLWLLSWELREKRTVRGCKSGFPWRRTSFSLISSQFFGISISKKWVRGDALCRQNLQVCGRYAPRIKSWIRFCRRRCCACLADSLKYTPHTPAHPTPQPNLKSPIQNIPGISKYGVWGVHFSLAHLKQNRIRNWRNIHGLSIHQSPEGKKPNVT